jgi:hypothetical protein
MSLVFAYTVYLFYSALTSIERKYILSAGYFGQLFYMVSKLVMLKVICAVVVATADIYDKNSSMERVSKSVQILLPVKINT